MAGDVQGKTFLVTGANRGIGKAIVERLLSAGAGKVYAAVRSLPSAEPLVKAGGGRVQAVSLDLAQPATIAAAAARATDVDVVISNAGVLKTASPFSENVFEALDFEIEINVKGLIRMAQAFAPTLKQRRGAFVQLNSVASLRSFADFATYSASKAAAYSITQALRDLLAPEGVQVVSVHPGPIATDMADAAGLTEMAEPASLVADGILAALASGEFHVFPDSMARDFWKAYEPFARSVVEGSIGEG